VLGRHEDVHEVRDAGAVGDHAQKADLFAGL
jgi:hypothetical protein